MKGQNGKPACQLLGLYDMLNPLDCHQIINELLEICSVFPNFIDFE